MAHPECESMQALIARLLWRSNVCFVKIYTVNSTSALHGKEYWHLMVGSQRVLTSTATFGCHRFSKDLRFAWRLLRIFLRLICIYWRLLCIFGDFFCILGSTIQTTNDHEHLPKMHQKCTTNIHRKCWQKLISDFLQIDGRPKRKRHCIGHTTATYFWKGFLCNSHVIWASLEHKDSLSVSLDCVR